MERLTVMGTLTTTQPEVHCSGRQLRAIGVTRKRGHYTVAWECTGCYATKWSTGEGDLHIQSSPCTSEPKTEIVFNLDMAKIRRVIDGKHKPPQITTIINPSFTDALSYIEQVRKECTLHQTPVSMDIEVISLETACVGLAQSSKEAICINWRTLDSQRYTVEEERELRKALQRLFLTRDIRLIAQNGSFDISWLWYKDGIYVPQLWFDTMLAHHTPIQHTAAQSGISYDSVH